VLPGLAVAEPGGRPVAVDDVAIAIGPEGGWSAKELEVAASAVTLGPNILRVETAAVAAAALMVSHR
jgi:16S rRNA (uracil1498-N3)-methyltransferase